MEEKLELKSRTRFTKSKSTKPSLKRGEKQAYDPNADLKKGIWLYFFLLVFEGALRKWILPGLATPLLLVRDPVALWIILTAYSRGLVVSNLFLTGTISIGIIGIFTSVLFGHGNLMVALYGARAFVLHFPLIFVIGRIFNREDVLKLGKVVIWFATPMALLIAMQFYSPQSAWVNKTIGGETGAGFTGALGFFRPTGTFSFTNGNTLFFSLVACFVLYFWLNPKSVNKLILIGATGGLLMSIPLSISRGLFFGIGVTVIFVVFAASRKPKYLAKMLLAGVGICVLLLLVSQFGFFKTALNAFLVRFNTADESEGGVQGVLLDRYLGGLLNAFSFSSATPFFGYGLGMFSNVGSKLLSGRTVGGIAEGEWGRMIRESGPLFGLLLIFFRLGAGIKVTVAAYKKLNKGDLLPWILLSFCLLLLPQGNWSQPTSLGFSTLIAGLVFAAARNQVKKPSYPVLDENIGTIRNRGIK